MKLEAFVEKFDQFVDAPDAVAKMRELVLQLAVRGRLSEQEPIESPNAQLEIAEDFRIRRRRSFEVSPEDSRFLVPDNWGWVPVGAAMDMVNGKAFKPEEWSAQGTPIIRIQNLNNENAPFNRCSADLDPKIHVHDGDFLISWSGTPGTSFGAFIWNRGFAFLNQHIFRCELVEGVYEKEYLRLAVNARLDEMISHAHGGVGLRHITKGDLENIALPLPPLSEQSRIVAKVDELMALCDRLEAQQKERETQHIALTRAAIARFDEAPTPANLNFLFHPSYSVTPADLRKTILNLAVQGKLVSQDLSDEAAATSLARLGLVQETGSLNEVIQKDEQIPESWSLVRFEDVAIVTGGVTLGRKLGDRKTVTLPYLRVANVKRGEIDVDIMKEVTIAEDEIERYALHENDLLMTEGGDWDKVGRAAIWNGEISPCLHQNHIFRARMRSAEIKPFWFERYFNSPLGRSYFESASKQTTNLASINMRQVRGCPVPFPPLAEQHRILSRIDQLMKLVDKLDRQIAASESTARDLLNAVVHDLLHPSADVVEFPKNEADRASQRAAIGCYAIEHLLRNPSFGRVMLMKACYLSETHLGLSLGWQPMRQAAGPWDPWIEDFESLGTRSDWFTVTEKALYNGHSKIEYSTKKGIKTKAAEAIKILGSQKAEFDRLLDLFADKSTEDAEIITTLFAAWNDFLIDGKSPTDDEIIHEVRENWHQTKERFTPTRLGHWLNWMRDHRLCPKGNPPRTRQQLKLSLN